MESLPARPRKVAPPHPGTVIADAIDGIGLSLRRAALDIGMSPTGLAKVLQGQSRVTASTALRLAAYLGASPELWLQLQMDYDLRHESECIAGELSRIEPPRLTPAGR